MEAAGRRTSRRSWKRCKLLVPTRLALRRESRKLHTYSYSSPGPGPEHYLRTEGIICRRSIARRANCEQSARAEALAVAVAVAVAVAAVGNRCVGAFLMRAASKIVEFCHTAF